jgi:hypothetical protein
VAATAKRSDIQLIQENSPKDVVLQTQIQYVIECSQLDVQALRQGTPENET